MVVRIVTKGLTEKKKKKRKIERGSTDCNKRNYRKKKRKLENVTILIVQSILLNPSEKRSIKTFSTHLDQKKKK